MDKSNIVDGLLVEVSAVVWCFEELERLRGGGGQWCTLLTSGELDKDYIKVERMDTSTMPCSFDVFLCKCSLLGLMVELPEGAFCYTGMWQKLF